MYSDKILFSKMDSVAFFLSGLKAREDNKQERYFSPSYESAPCDCRTVGGGCLFVKGPPALSILTVTWEQ